MCRVAVRRRCHWRAGDPLTVRTAYSSNTLDWPSYGLKATARDSINLRNEKDVANAAKYSGNLLLISAESLTGDVRIETSGSVIDNNPIASTDVRSQAELAALFMLASSLAVTNSVSFNILLSAISWSSSSCIRLDAMSRFSFT